MIRRGCIGGAGLPVFLMHACITSHCVEPLRPLTEKQHHQPHGQALDLVHLVGRRKLGQGPHQPPSGGTSAPSPQRHHAAGRRRDQPQHHQPHGQALDLVQLVGRRQLGQGHTSPPAGARQPQAPSATTPQAGAAASPSNASPTGRPSTWCSWSAGASSGGRSKVWTGQAVDRSVTSVRSAAKWAGGRVCPCGGENAPVFWFHAPEYAPACPRMLLDFAAP
jgi:hypothetical protein